MEIPPNSDTKPSVRRRLIQSTLFPHKSPDNVVSVDELIAPDLDQNNGEDKAVSNSEASRKVCV